MEYEDILDYLVETGCDELEAEFWWSFLLDEFGESAITLDNIEEKLDELPPWVMESAGDTMDYTQEIIDDKIFVYHTNKYIGMIYKRPGSDEYSWVLYTAGTRVSSTRTFRQTEDAFTIMITIHMQGEKHG